MPLRLLRRAPAFTTAAVLTLAVAVGVIVTTFTLVNAILLRELPYPDPERLVLVHSKYGVGYGDSGAISAPDFHDRREARAFAGAAAWERRGVNLTEGEPERVEAARVTDGFWNLFGLGRNQSQQSVQISDRLWRSRFGARPVVGRTIRIDDVPYTVAGVMPATFGFPEKNVDVWLPLELTAADFADGNRGNENLWMLARLRDGVSLAQAQAEMSVITERAREAVPDRRQFLIDSNWRVELTSLRNEIVGKYESALVLLFAAGALVLLLAVANVSGLFLARTVARTRELAVRHALGAGRMRIARELAAEVAAVTLAGAALGVFFAALALPLVARTGLPRAAEWRIDAVVVAFTLVMCAAIATGVSALIAAFAARADDLALRDRSATAAGARMRGILVAAQVAIAVTLVASGALLLESYRRLRAVETGFDPNGVIAFRLTLPRTTYGDSAKQRAFFERLQTRLKSTPRVLDASAISELPFASEAWTMTFDIHGRPVQSGQETPGANTRLVLPRYTETMRIPLLRGRTFQASDDANAPRVVVIDETAARRWWPNENPIGRRITFSGNVPNPTWREIVGVVGAVRHDALNKPAEPHVYLPLLQSGGGQMYVVVRGPATLATDIRALVRSIDPMQPVHGLRSMQEYLDDATEQPRLRATLVAIFAAIGVLLAGVGLYALLAFIVASRTREVGVRVALGATPAAVVRFIVMWSLRVTAAGIALGLMGAVAMTHSMRALLFGVDPLDAATYALVAASFIVLAITASAVPAFRISRIDPAAALRHE